VRTPNFDPGDPPEQDTTCEVCGRDCDACICPICPVCNTQGDPECYRDHGLVESDAQRASRDEAEAAMEARWESDIAQGRFLIDDNLDIY
jgi:hypothetical protein